MERVESGRYLFSHWCCLVFCTPTSSPSPYIYCPPSIHPLSSSPPLSLALFRLILFRFFFRFSLSHPVIYPRLPTVPSRTKEGSVCPTGTGQLHLPTGFRRQKSSHPHTNNNILRKSTKSAKANQKETSSPGVIVQLPRPSPQKNECKITSSQPHLRRVPESEPE
ncbi:hypothetical protein BDW42DRAFT_65335 [Aspergillus taichungensis]|uniref:Uncharacterized protein n=1 Tax=Aspergillus taichungensis TaxID=482145 RepID=A0A2J5I0Y2_9EURO|nr:hypothetical protein BDW42DRAFT_65335 [Aspergillus taichungensis]